MALSGRDKSPNGAAPRASVHTLGCRLNQSESAAIRRSLEQAGYEIVPWGEEAEVCVLNSCTVTAQSDAKSRQALRSMRRRHPNTRLALVGCYAQTQGEILAGMGIADLIVGNGGKMHVVKLLAELLAELPETLTGGADPLLVRPPLTRSPFKLDVFAAVDGKTRAALKVQDGCDFMCTFCIIPTARGRARARALPNLLEEAGHLAAAGVKEIVLTGVNLGTYEEGGATLVEVVDRLNEMPGLARIRISSIEPATVGEGLLERMADAAHRLVPFLHLPLQSGSARILQAMRRKYTGVEFRRFAELAAARVPGLGLGTDVMVGFPGEDDEAFEETRALLQALPFAYFHVFPYSQRPGTPAVRLPEQVPARTRQRRAALLHALSAEKQLAFQEAHRNRVAEVLFERDRGDGWARGLTENYLRVAVATAGAVATGEAAALHNRITPVRLTTPGAEAMTGELCAPLAENGMAGNGMAAAPRMPRVGRAP